jgi:hypothetical protein
MRTMGSASSPIAAGPGFNKRAHQSNCGYEIFHQAQSCAIGSSTIHPNRRSSSIARAVQSSLHCFCKPSGKAP